MGSPWYKIMLGMSYYIHAGGLGALVDVVITKMTPRSCDTCGVMRHFLSYDTCLLSHDTCHVTVADVTRHCVV